MFGFIGNFGPWEIGFIIGYCTNHFWSGEAAPAGRINR